MSPILLILLISFAAAALFVICNGIIITKKPLSSPSFLQRFRKKAKSNMLHIADLTELAAWLLFAELLLLLGSHLAVSALMQHGDTILPLPLVIAVNLLLYGTVSAALWCNHAKLRRALNGILAAAAVLFAAEVFVFNGKSITGTKTDERLSISTMTYTEDSSISAGKDELVIYGNAVITLNALPPDTGALILEMSQQQVQKAHPFRLKIGLKDDSSQSVYQTAAVKYPMAYDVPVSVTLHPYGTLHSVELQFTQIGKPITLSGVTAFSAIPFSFSLLRYFLLLAAISCCILIRTYRLYTIVYDPNRLSHTVAVAAVMAICCTSGFFFLRPGDTAIVYEKGRDYSGNDLYVQQFDAFQKGQLALDIDAEPALEALENVYDRETRDKSGIFYKWDFAYYEGEYYSYFGVAPLFVFYYPYYALTGNLPSTSMATTFFVSLAICFFCLTIPVMLQLLGCKANLLLLLCMMPASVCAMCIHYALQWSHSVYYLPVAAGLCFLFLCLLLGFCGCMATAKRSRYLLFFGSGVALALCAGSRPTLAIHAALLLPFFFGILFHKSAKLPFRIKQAICFLLPVCVGVAALMVYNVLRFDSPLEFGASYQLTVSDVRANELRLSNLPAALYHYFCQLPRPRNAFPYFEPQYHALDNYGRYIFNSHQIGALTYPMIGLGLLLIPLGKYSKTDSATGTVTLLQKKTFLILTFMLAAALAWFDFCVGGADTRYTIDIMPALLPGVILVLMRCNRTPKKYPYLLTVGALGLTVVIQFLLLIQMWECNLAMRCPNLYDIAENLLIFWR